MYTHTHTHIYIYIFTTWFTLWYPRIYCVYYNMKLKMWSIGADCYRIIVGLFKLYNGYFTKLSGKIINFFFFYFIKLALRMNTCYGLIWWHRTILEVLLVTG